MSEPRSLLPFRSWGEWWLEDGAGNVYGPFSERQVKSRFGRYRGLRRHSGASRRACWKRAGEMTARA